jgi:hypothetical protein
VTGPDGEPEQPPPVPERSWLACDGPQNITLADGETFGAYFSGMDGVGAIALPGPHIVMVRPGAPADGLGPDLGPVMSRLVAVQDLQDADGGTGRLLRALSADVAHLVAEVAARRRRG